MKTESVWKNFLKLIGSCLRRTIFLYVLMALLLYHIVDYQSIVVKTMDYYQDIPQELLSYAIGNEQLDAKKIKHASRYYKYFLELFPDSTQALSALGFCYYQLGNNSKAIYYYQRAIDKNPRFFGVYHNLGLIYYQMGKYQKAIEFLQKAVAIPFDGTLSSKETGFYQLTINEPSTFQNDPVSSLVLGYNKCYEYLILCYKELGDYSAMLTIASETGKLPMNADGIFDHYTGEALHHLKQYQEAVFFLQRSLKKGPLNRESYRYLRLSLEQLGLDTMAEDVQRQENELVPQKEPKGSDKSREILPLFFHIPIYTLEMADGTRIMKM